jgi:thioredoxin-dependent peroxiredoxin
VIYGVSFDTVEENRAFAEKFDYPFLLLSDPDRTLPKPDGAGRDTGNSARRISYLIGPDRVVVKCYETVKPAEHPDQVLRDLGA